MNVKYVQFFWMIVIQAVNAFSNLETSEGKICRYSVDLHDILKSLEPLKFEN